MSKNEFIDRLAAATLWLISHLKNVMKRSPIIVNILKMPDLKNEEAIMGIRLTGRDCCCH